MYLLGLDIGSSSIKASIVEAETGKCIANGQAPQAEMVISSPQTGWAEQLPDDWWKYSQQAIRQVINDSKISPSDLKAIGISYQMHGLVCVDKNGDVLRPSIIWCDSRAVEIGAKALKSIGDQVCLKHFLNSPGNFTASKLRWVKENEPEIFAKIYKIMLPGDYIAYKMTGDMRTTASGLSEGIMWDYVKKGTADILLEHYQISKSFLAELVPTFGLQGNLTASAASFLGLSAGTPITYRAGDQPNNALSLNVLNPGEVAATAGTSGVVYGVSGKSEFDTKSRVNTFVHVNNTVENTRNGILLCINGTGILNSWVRKNIAESHSYSEINDIAEKIAPGSDGVLIFPFGNGAERMLENKEIGCHVQNIDFNRHSKAHILRAEQEGIAFSFCYGMSIMEAMGVETRVIRAGHANMFLSKVFRQTLSDITGATIELYNTDGAQGAAAGAGIGSGIYKSSAEAFRNLTCIEKVLPIAKNKEILQQAYNNWQKLLNKKL